MRIEEWKIRRNDRNGRIEEWEIRIEKWDISIGGSKIYGEMKGMGG